MPDLEGRKFAGSGLGIDMLITDVAAHLIADFGQKSCQFRGLAFGDQLDSPVGQVPNIAGDGEATCDRLRAVAEADTLHVAAEVDRFAHWGVGGAHGDGWPNTF